MLISCKRETHFVEIFYEKESEVAFLITISTAIQCRYGFCVLVGFYYRRFGDNHDLYQTEKTESVLNFITVFRCSLLLTVNIPIFSG
jgi:hypothetical protein